MAKNKPPQKKNQHTSHGHTKSKRRDAWLIFSILGITFGIVGAFLSNTSNSSYYLLGAVIGGAIGFLIGRSLDKLAERKHL